MNLTIKSPLFFKNETSNINVHIKIPLGLKLPAIESYFKNVHRRVIRERVGKERWFTNRIERDK